jgi:hypothetical protein
MNQTDVDAVSDCQIQRSNSRHQGFLNHACTKVCAVGRSALRDNLNPGCRSCDCGSLCDEHSDGVFHAPSQDERHSPGKVAISRRLPLSCAEQFRAMAFAQLTYRESLRDIEASVSAQSAKLYHMGFREPVRRSTLADANAGRDWRIYAEFAQRLIAQARRLYSASTPQS